MTNKIILHLSTKEADAECQCAETPDGKSWLYICGTFESTNGPSHWESRSHFLKIDSDRACPKCLQIEFGTTIPATLVAKNAVKNEASLPKGRRRTGGSNLSAEFFKKYYGI